LIYKIFYLIYIKQNIHTMEYDDKIVLGIAEYLSKQENENGEVSKLMGIGYDLKLIDSLMYAGLISIFKADCKDPNGRYVVTELGKKYFKIILKVKS